MKRTKAFELCAVPLLMAAIAGNQMRLARGHSLSPWKGGGFGMFSTVDGPGNRRLACEGVDSTGRAWVVDLGRSPALADRARRLCTFPTRAGLDAFAQELLATSMAELGATEEELARRLARDNPELDVGQVEVRQPFGILVPSDGGGAPGETLRLARVELVVYGIEWDPRAATVRYRRIGPSREAPGGELVAASLAARVPAPAAPGERP